MSFHYKVMDERYVKTFQELNNMQSKIASLFKDLLVETYHFKLNYEKGKKNLEEVSVEIQNLKIENAKLQQENQELKSVIHKCLQDFEHLKFSKINLKDYDIVADTLKNFLSQSDDVRPEMGDVSLKKESENSTKRCNINDDDIKKEIDSLQGFEFTTQFFDNDEMNKEKKLLNNNQSDMFLEKFFDRKTNEILKNFEKHLLIKETEPFDERNVIFCSEVQETVDPLTEVTTPKKKLMLNSPVFKDFGCRRQENSSAEDNSIHDSRRKVINGKLFQKSVELIISPLKKNNTSNSVSPKREMSSPKRSRKKLRVDSPKSPVNQLKKSNSREAEITISGARKLTQTLLNIECFKKGSPEKGKTSEDVECEENFKLTEANETKALGDIDEDDVIMDSPKKFDVVLEKIKNKKKTGSNEKRLLSTPTTSDADPDETCVSASLIKKCQDVLEKINEVKLPDRERSPGDDSVPFAYKRKAVRSKAERMRLPGHTCLECNKYYKNALGEDISPRKLKEILNKCSRHRDKNSPSLDDTPPGYWKPFLTPSVMTSHNKDDTIIQ